MWDIGIISAASATSDNKCFFCELRKDIGDLRKASTFKVDERVRKCAHILEDSLLLGKLSSGNMIAHDAVYHINCLSTLYRKAEKAHLMDETDNTERHLHGIALAELVSYIDETRDYKDEVPSTETRRPCNDVQCSPESAWSRCI